MIENETCVKPGCEYKEMSLLPVRCFTNKLFVVCSLVWSQTVPLFEDDKNVENLSNHSQTLSLFRKHIINLRLKIAEISKFFSSHQRCIMFSIRNKMLAINFCLLSIITYYYLVWGFICKSILNHPSGFHENQLNIIRKDSRYLRNTINRSDLRTQ